MSDNQREYFVEENEQPYYVDCCFVITISLRNYTSFELIRNTDRYIARKFLVCHSDRPRYENMQANRNYTNMFC
jgi:hypothetical protein